MRGAGALIRLALDLVFPRRCVTCGAYGAYLCDRCGERLVRAEPPRCRRCWRPAGGAAWCRGCAAGDAALAAVRAAYVFQGPSRDLVHALKYQGVRAVAPLMAEAMMAAAELLPCRPDVLVPVPLHGRRQRERGYNQAALLARACGAGLGVPVWEDGLVRRRATPSQARMSSAGERLTNVQGAFSCRRPYRFADSVVVLVDDVTTTGATLEACARELRLHGAARVYGLTFAVDD